MRMDALRGHVIQASMGMPFLREEEACSRRRTLTHQFHDPRLSIFTRLPACAESVNIASMISLDLRMRRFSALSTGAGSTAAGPMGGEAGSVGTGEGDVLWVVAALCAVGIGWNVRRRALDCCG